MDSVICLIRNMFCNDILCPGNGICRQIATSLSSERQTPVPLPRRIYPVICKHNDICQGLQTPFRCNGGTGTSLRTVWTVKILHHNQSLGSQDLRFQLWGQLALILNTGQAPGFSYPPGYEDRSVAHSGYEAARHLKFLWLLFGIVE